MDASGGSCDGAGELDPAPCPAPAPVPAREGEARRGLGGVEGVPEEDEEEGALPVRIPPSIVIPPTAPAAPAGPADPPTPPPAGSRLGSDPDTPPPSFDTAGPAPAPAPAPCLSLAAALSSAHSRSCLGEGPTARPGPVGALLPGSTSACIPAPTPSCRETSAGAACNPLARAAADPPPALEAAAGRRCTGAGCAMECPARTCGEGLGSKRDTPGPASSKAAAVGEAEGPLLAPCLTTSTGELRLEAKGDSGLCNGAPVPHASSCQPLLGSAADGPPPPRRAALPAGRAAAGPLGASQSTSPQPAAEEEAAHAPAPAPGLPLESGRIAAYRSAAAVAPWEVAERACA